MIKPRSFQEHRQLPLDQQLECGTPEELRQVQLDGWDPTMFPVNIGPPVILGCYDCGSRHPFHHTPTCEFADDLEYAVRDMPDNTPEGSVHVKQL